MYNIENPFCIKIWDITRQSYMTIFDNKQDFVRFLSSYFHRQWHTNANDMSYIVDIRNSFMDKCVCCQNEVSAERYIQVFDAYNRTINVRDFWDEAYEYRDLKMGFCPAEVYNYEIWAKRIEWQRRYSLRYKRSKSIRRIQEKQKKNLRFRIDPVPMTGKNHKYRYFCRLPRTKQIKTILADSEMKPFNRGKLKEIPKWWDDCRRDYQRSWKEQSKARHQWQRKRKV